LVALQKKTEALHEPSTSGPGASFQLQTPAAARRLTDGDRRARAAGDCEPAERRRELLSCPAISSACTQARSRRTASRSSDTRAPRVASLCLRCTAPGPTTARVRVHATRSSEQRDCPVASQPATATVLRDARRPHCRNTAGWGCQIRSVACHSYRWEGRSKKKRKNKIRTRNEHDGPHMGPLLDPLGGPRALDPRNSSGMHVEELGPTTLASCTTHVGGGTVGRWECGGSSRRAASRSRGPSWRELYAFSPLACVASAYTLKPSCFNVSCIYFRKIPVPPFSLLGYEDLPFQQAFISWTLFHLLPVI
jgi:hypothetical protein